MVGPMDTLLQSIKGFLKEPFATPMSFWQYSAVVGLTIILVVLWVMVLHEIARGIKEV